MAASPRFWWRDGPSAAALALWPVSRLWGAVAARRMERAPGYWAPVPVVCIGNFTVGGEGKTPTALAVAVILAADGFRPGFLIRGYGGSARGPLLVDPARHGPAEVGDEALLLVREATTVVARDRAAGAKLLAKAGVEVIVMDDGFQNPGLGKDLTLIVADASAGIGNARTLPAGPLRAPLRTQLGHTGALVVIGDGNAAGPLIRLAGRAGRRVLRARFRPEPGVDWGAAPVLAFAGIGRPDKFFRSLEEAGAKFAGRVAFPDHHAFTEAEAATLLARAESGSLRLVTTEKDHVRLPPTAGALGRLRQVADVFRVTIAFDDPEAVRGLLHDALAAPRRRP